MANKWTLRIGAPSFKGGDLDGYSPAQVFDVTNGTWGEGANATPLYQALQRTPDFSGNLILTPPTNLRSQLGSTEPITYAFPRGMNSLGIHNLIVAGCVNAGSVSAVTPATVPA